MNLLLLALSLFGTHPRSYATSRVQAYVSTYEGEYSEAVTEVGIEIHFGGEDTKEAE